MTAEWIDVPQRLPTSGPFVASLVVPPHRFLCPCYSEHEVAYGILDGWCVVAYTSPDEDHPWMFQVLGSGRVYLAAQKVGLPPYYPHFIMGLTVGSGAYLLHEGVGDIPVPISQGAEVEEELFAEKCLKVSEIVRDCLARDSTDLPEEKILGRLSDLGSNLTLDG